MVPLYHVSVGGGVPEPSQRKVADWPIETVSEEGVMVGRAVDEEEEGGWRGEEGEGGGRGEE